ncbi:MAG: hypothetical protein ACRDPT_16250 [Streptomycetales bacterium]
MARAPALLWQTAHGPAQGIAPGPVHPAYLLLVPCSFGGYLADWLVEAMGEYSAPPDQRWTAVRP